MTNIREVIITKVDLKKLAKKSGFTMKSLAGEAGISYAHLLRISNNKFGMSFAYWTKIKAVLDANLKANK